MRIYEFFKVQSYIAMLVFVASMYDNMEQLGGFDYSSYISALLTLIICAILFVVASYKHVQKDDEADNEDE
jgi:hypothetical protein